jgi:hypothetical protein
MAGFIAHVGGHSRLSTGRAAKWDMAGEFDMFLGRLFLDSRRMVDCLSCMLSHFPELCTFIGAVQIVCFLSVYLSKLYSF